MKKFLLFFVCGSLALITTDSYAALRYRSGTELLTENSEAVDFQFQNFKKNLSYDEEGAELALGPEDSFTTTDLSLKYSRGLFLNFETSAFLKYRSVKSELNNYSATNSGLESIGLEAKYLFLNRKSFRNAFAIHVKKTPYTNTLYTLSDMPPLDKISLGDDGLQYGVDYLATYYDQYLKYDFKIGYNKPSASLSSEIIYNAELVHHFSRASILAGIGGITSLKNDQYTETPVLKPIISSGNDRLFNSINREKKYLYAGLNYGFDNIIAGVKVESIFSGKSTDKGNTISFNIRLENNVIAPLPKSTFSRTGAIQEYFADGFIEKLSTSKNMFKMNIGLNKNVKLNDNVDIYNVDDYTSGQPICTGVVASIGQDWSIVKVIKRYKKLPIEVGHLVRVY